MCVRCVCDVRCAMSVRVRACVGGGELLLLLLGFGRCISTPSLTLIDTHYRFYSSINRHGIRIPKSCKNEMLELLEAGPRTAAPPPWVDWGAGANVHVDAVDDYESDSDNNDFYRPDEDEDYTPFLVLPKNKDGRVCRCGSDTHLTVQSHACPLNPRYRSTRLTATASATSETDTTASTTSETDTTASTTSETDNATATTSETDNATATTSETDNATTSTTTNKTRFVNLPTPTHALSIVHPRAHYNKHALIITLITHTDRVHLGNRSFLPAAVVEVNVLWAMLVVPPRKNVPDVRTSYKTKRSRFSMTTNGGPLVCFSKTGVARRPTQSNTTTPSTPTVVKTVWRGR